MSVNAAQNFAASAQDRQSWASSASMHDMLPADERINAPAAQSDQEFSFWDFLDVINPLQHIPIVNNLYREATGDTIKPTAQIVGGVLFGGPIGLLAATLNASAEQEHGRSIGGQLLAALRGGDGTAANVAQAATQEGGTPVAAPATDVAANTAAAADDTTAVATTTDPRLQAQMLAANAPDKTPATGAAQQAQTPTTGTPEDQPRLTAGKFRPTTIPAPGAATSAAVAGQGVVPEQAAARGPTNFFQRLQSVPPGGRNAPASARTAAQASAPAMAPAAAPARSAATQTKQPADATGQAPMPGQPVPKDQVANQMMRALERYQALSRNNQARLGQTPGSIS
ncbi:MAG TPA: hypothetical protein VEY95_16250 [Azospirillaceae bacterium]|nr:hypothetical protein [Azospirillaceae bacterium]